MATTPRWEKRLAKLVTHGLPTEGRYPKTPKGGVDGKMTLTRYNEKTDYEWEADLFVWAEYEPAQRGGWTDPSWDAHTYSPRAWQRRHGGWVETDLNEREAEEVCEHLNKQLGRDDY